MQPDVCEDVSDTMDDLRKRFGPKIICLGPHRDLPGGYLGGKIAFGHIPDNEDFANVPIADGDTHFCTM